MSQFFQHLLRVQGPSECRIDLSLELPTWGPHTLASELRSRCSGKVPPPAHLSAFADSSAEDYAVGFPEHKYLRDNSVDALSWTTLTWGLVISTHSNRIGVHFSLEPESSVSLKWD